MMPIRSSPSRRSSGVIMEVMRRPSRSHRNSIGSPGRTLISSRMPDQVATGRPSTAVIRSPRCRPSPAAGVPGSVLPTRGGSSTVRP